MKKAFTLLEVNLAIFVMAVAVLGMAALYPLGFREAEQSVEDVAAASACEAIVNSLAAHLTATNARWSAWQAMKQENAMTNPECYPKNGWTAYFDRVGENPFGEPKGRNAMTSLAKSTFQQVMQATGGTPDWGAVSWPNVSSDLACALVVSFEGTRCSISCRAVRRPAMLLAQPLYHTEVCFQGDMTR